ANRCTRALRRLRAASGECATRHEAVVLRPACEAASGTREARAAVADSWPRPNTPVRGSDLARRTAGLDPPGPARTHGFAAAASAARAARASRDRYRGGR